MKKTLTIMIPVYNEAERLEKTFSALAAGLQCREFKLAEVIFVNDGSTDSTLKILNKKKAYLEKKLMSTVKIVSYKTNKGKGYAVKKGMINSSSNYLLLADADISTPFDEIKKFEGYVREGADVVVGTRKNGESTVVVPQPIYRQVLGRIYTLLSQLILNTWVSDFTCGFKLFERKAYRTIGKEMKIERWGYDSELVYLAKKYDFDLKEKAVAWYNDDRTKVNLGKDALGSLKELVQIRINDLMGAYTKGKTRGNLVERVLPWVQKA